jgi:hypothetical protein
MNEDPRINLVSDLVDAIDERTPSQTDFIMAALVRGAWPGGIGDRLDPAALEWVKRWGPDGVEPPCIEDCSCVDGRCAVCN